MKCQWDFAVAIQSGNTEKAESWLPLPTRQWGRMCEYREITTNHESKDETYRIREDALHVLSPLHAW